MSLGLVANVYNEINALPGWLETHLPVFDDVRVYHSGPQGAMSNDGTVELLEKWRVPYAVGSIDDGFGAVRTHAVRSSPCEWVMLLDADERFYPVLPILTCEGESTPPDEVDKILYDYGDPNYQPYDASIDFTAVPSNFENLGRLGAKLRVTRGATFDHATYLRSLLAADIDAVKVVRRHWHDFSWKRPTQNWHTDADYQTRIIRNNDSIYWDPSSRMHERLCGAVSVRVPNHTQGPFFDHYHCFFKRMEVAQRKHDVLIYNAINKGEVPPC